MGARLGTVPLPTVPSQQKGGTYLSSPHSHHLPPTRSQGRTPHPHASTPSSEAQLHGDQPTAQDPGEGPAPKSRAPG